MAEQQPKQSDGTVFKKARRHEVGKTVASSTTDELELGDTPCYSQKSHQTNDSSNLDILDILDVECALPTSSILDILDVECVLPIVSGYLSRKEKMCFAMSVSCVNGCEGQLTDSTSRFGVKPSCNRCEKPICGCNEKMKDFEFCPDCEHYFCGACVRDEEENFERECDLGRCKISGCYDCRSDKMHYCSECYVGFCKGCGTSCEYCYAPFCRVEEMLECDCEERREHLERYGWHNY